MEKRGVSRCCNRLLRRVRLLLLVFDHLDLRLEPLVTVLVVRLVLVAV